MSSVEIIPMERQHIEKAARVISRSFQTEEFAKNTLDFSDPETEALFAELLQIELTVFKKHGEKVELALYEGEIAGVYTMKITDANHGFSNFKQLLKRIRKVIPVSKRVKYKNLFKLYSAMKKPKIIPGGALLLEILAVDPDFQGKGIGRAIMASVDAYAEAAGRPVYLYTANKGNVGYYEKFGYKLMEVIPKKDFTAYHMLKNLKDE